MRIISLLLVLLLVACAPRLNTRRDDFKRITIHESAGNVLAGGSSLLVPGASVVLDPQLVTFDSGESGYRLSLAYMGDDWLFVRPGESLGLRIDGRSVVLEGEGSIGYREVIGSRVEERAVWPVEAATICALANASQVAVRIYGQTQNLDRQFTEENIQAYKAFVAEHVPSCS